MAEIKTSVDSKEEKEQEVFITEITLHKVRHLENLRIPLSTGGRKHLILTGRNGSGKTSVLECLKKNIWDSLQSGNIESGGPFFEDMIKEVSWQFNDNDTFRRYCGSGHFLLSFYGAKRHAEMTIPKGLNKIDWKKHYPIDEYPGKEFIQYIVNLKAEKSFARDENDYVSVKNIDKWFEMFENTLKDIFEDRSLRLEFDRKNYNFKILQKGKEPFDFNTLADGYSAIISVVTDLILRMEKHKKTTYDIQGIVLIDELETHLHIDLQKKVFPFLTRFFPRVQFIVTTHSPFILSSATNAVIYDLENHLLVEDLSGYAYDGIVESYFDNDKYSESIKSKVARYEKLVAQADRSEEEKEQMVKLREYLKEIPGTLAPELKAKFQQIELNRIGRG